MASVAIEHLDKTFRGSRGHEFFAVHDLTFSVREKELLVLVGPSGCGKTTTLRVIAGLEGATRGTIRIDGREVTNVPPGDRDIAMVFQNHALYPHLSVHENMAFGLKLRKFPRAEIDQRVRDAAAMLGLDESLDARPKTLSGGQRQRVALGRAIVRNPRLFLFDEPLSNLDAPMRAQMRRELSRLQARLGVTTIYVTHDQAEAMTLGHRVAVMNAGALQQIADPATLYRNPANRFVAGFIGSPPMNFFDGTLARNGSALWFREQRSDRPDVDSISLPVEPEAAARLESYSGRDIVLGIRPEDITDKARATDAPAERSIEAMVEVVEPMGAETLLYLSGAHPFVVRMPAAHGAAPDDRINLVFDMRKARFFDPLTGKAIS